MNLFTAARTTLAAMMSILAPVLVSGAEQDSTSLAMSSLLSAISGSVTSTSTVPGVTASPKVHLVQVGAGGFHFEPAQLDDVSVGDVVTFEFYPPDHSVARAEYGKEPCMPYEYTGKGRTGFWSGTQWVDTVRDITHWNLTINSTEPIFYYCAAPDSCREKLMVGAINPNGTQTLDAQIRAARGAEIRVAPGEAIPKEIASSAMSENSALATSSTSDPSTDRHSSKLSGGAIAGIVVGGIVFLIVCAGVLVCVARSRRMKAVDQPVETVSSAGQLPEYRDADAFYSQTLSPVSPEYPQTTSFSHPTTTLSVSMAKMIQSYNC
ncbi:hypothetical protein HBI60_254170 [Parastagonospora nodorum]|nr:hypothetical protein HBI60_254170 [Parastagonospora nodorum]